MKNKMTAGLLALFVGGFGVHKFYLGQTGIGVVYLLFCWTGIPGIIAFIEGIILLTMSDDDFNAKYNGNANAQKNTTTTYVPVATPDAVNRQSSPDIAKILMTYKNLLDTGVITQQEFDAIKRKLLKHEV